MVRRGSSSSTWRTGIHTSQFTNAPMANADGGASMIYLRVLDVAMTLIGQNHKRYGRKDSDPTRTEKTEHTSIQPSHQPFYPSKPNHPHTFISTQ
jgi:hypothetical protein